MDRTAMLTSKLFLFFLYVSISSILVAGDEVYGKRGGEITLTPSLSGLLNRIVWKHGDDKAIEWEGGPTDAYRQFKGSTSLDTKTGEMRITKLDSRFIGVYSADVNGIQATKKWKLTLLDPVSKPSIVKVCNESTCELSCKSKATVKGQYAWRKGEEELQKYNRTLVLEKTDDKVGKAYICNYSNPVSFAVSEPFVPFPPDPVSKPITNVTCHESTCKLSCKNKATVEVQCAWRKGEEELRQSDGTLVLEKTDDKVGKAYTCNCSNSVSFAVSDPVVPFPNPNPLVGIIVGLLSGLFILGGVIAFIFREKLMKFGRTHLWMRGNAAADNQGGAKDASQKNAAVNQDGANETSEDMPLKGNADHADEGGAKDASQKNGAVNQDGANETSQGDTPNGPNA